jgi:PAS domain S-box-containing protein
MSATETEPAKLTQLRSDAESKLKAGEAPATLGWSMGVNALGLIHKLASSPDSAIDALKLLHEVQVHQVELDLQHQQLEVTQREMGEELEHFQKLYEYAPVGYLNVGPKLDILECNIAAAKQFGIVQDEVRGRDFESLLSPASRVVLRQLLNQLPPDGSSESCEVRAVAGSTMRRLRVVASHPPGGQSFLVVLLDLTSDH